MARVNLRDTITGQVFNIEDTQVNNAIATGNYRLETPQEAKTSEYLAENDGITGQLKAAGANLLDAATLGVSDVLINKYKPELAENLEALKEENPISAGIGTGVGLGASLLTGGPIFKGASVVGKEVGKAVSKSITEGLAQKIVKPITTLAAEGAVVSAPKAVTELLTGDPNYGSETLIAGVLSGGALGGILGAGGLAMKAAKPAGDILKKLIPDGLKGSSPEKAAMDYLQMTIPQMRKTAPDIAEKLPNFLKDKVFVNAEGKTDWGIILSPDKLKLKNDKLNEKAAEEIGSIIRAASSEEALIKSIPTKATGVKDVDDAVQYVGKGPMPLKYKTMDPNQRTPLEIDNIALAERIENRILKPLEKKPIGEYRRIAEKIRNDYVTPLLEKPRNSILETNQIRMDIDRTINWRNTDETLLNEAKRGIRDIFKEEIFETVQLVDDLLAKRGIKRDYLARLEKANEQFRLSREIQPYIESMIDRAAKVKTLGFYNLASGGIGAAVAGVPGMLAGIVLNQTAPMMRSLSSLYFGNRKLSEFVPKINLPEIFKKPAFTENTTEKAMTAINRLLGNITENKTGIEYGSNKEEDKIKILNDTIANLQLNPEASANVVSNLTEEIGVINPNLAETFAVKWNQALAKIGEITPKSDKQTTPLDTTTTGMSSMEIKDFQRKLATLLEPSTILHDIANGTATPQQVEILKQVYPSTYERYVDMLQQYLTQPDIKLSNIQKNKVKLFLGMQQTAGIVTLQKQYNKQKPALPSQSKNLNMKPLLMASQQDSVLYRRAN